MQRRTLLLFRAQAADEGDARAVRGPTAQSVADHRAQSRKASRFDALGYMQADPDPTKCRDAAQAAAWSYCLPAGGLGAVAEHIEARSQRLQQ